ncbi:MAG: hypothetical protein ACYC35_30220, partial [Pirellulales bacterium]
ALDSRPAAVLRPTKKLPPEFVFQILDPGEARKPHDSSGFITVYAQNLPTNSDEEAFWKAVVVVGRNSWWQAVWQAIIP